jgi:hypothetical protein
VVFSLRATSFFLVCRSASFGTGGWFIHLQEPTTLRCRNACLAPESAARGEVLWDVSGGQEVCFLIAYMNFEVPEGVDSEISRNIGKVIRS